MNEHINHAVPLMPYKDIALIMIKCQTNTSVNGALQSIQFQRTRYLGASVMEKNTRISHLSEGELFGSAESTSGENHNQL